MSIRFAAIFPGQGSQSVGMLSDWFQTRPIVRQTFEEASSVLGYDLTALVLEGPKDRLDQTEITQPALLAAGVAVWRVLKQEFPKALPVFMAGHSLGEYTALVCADSLSFASGIACVQKRAQLMQSAVPAGMGAMAAVLGLDEPALIQKICDQVAEDEVVSAVNFNAIGQTVIAGHKGAVERAMIALKEAGAKRVLALPVSVPSHCALMKGIVEEFGAFLETMDWRLPTVSVIQNVNVKASSDVSSLVLGLKQQLYSPVRWVETIQTIAEQEVSLFLECGPGKVLTGLSKRILPGIVTLPILDDESLAQMQAVLEGNIRE